MNRKKVIRLIVITITILWIGFVLLGKIVPIHKADVRLESKQLYYIESVRTMLCDYDSYDIIIYEDSNYEYSYKLHKTVNPSCYSNLYLWDGLSYYRLNEAIELGIISLDDVLKSDLIEKSELSTE